MNNDSFIPYGLNQTTNNINEEMDTKVTISEVNELDYDIDDFGSNLGVTESTESIEEFKYESYDIESTLDSIDVIETNEDSIDNDTITDVEQNCSDIIDNEDIKIKLFNSFYDYRPLNMFISDNDIKEWDKIENCLVIEKLGDDIVTVERLGFRPSYIKGEKGSLVVKYSNLSDYIEWLKLDTIKRYNNSITEEEFDSIKKYIIIDNDSDKIELNSNETYLTRKEALSRVSAKYDVVIDLTMNNCHIKFTSEDNINCEIDAGGLGYEISSEIDWVDLMSKKLNILKGRNIIFTGLAGKEKLNSDLREKFDVKNNNNFESLAWEI